MQDSNPLSLDKKIALVTGASRGIGRATALLLAKRGAHVIVNYAGNEAAAHETLAAIVAAGGKGEIAKADVAKTADVEAMMKGALDRLGSLDVLVNNAGISIDGLLMRFKDEDWARVLDVNLGGAFRCARIAARAMLRQRRGRIVNVVSVVGEMGNGGQPAYCASKEGLVGLTLSMARELASRSITVNAVSPGFITTDMTASLAPAQLAKMLESVPLGRAGTAEEVASAIAWLASDEASYVTGHVLRVNGGMYM